MERETAQRRWKKGGSKRNRTVAERELWHERTERNAGV